MSKPESTSAKSLEEIIASIRKSLAGDGNSAARNGLARTEPVLPELPPLGPPSDLDALLSDRLAGALGGGAHGAAPEDDDLADILAHDIDKAPRSVAAKPADAEGERNSRWFAGHVLPEPTREDETEKLPSRDVAPEPADTRIELSRPELLRASLPPLFGEAAEASVRPAADPSISLAGLRSLFPALPAEQAPKPAADKAAEAPAAAAPTEAPAKAVANGTASPEPASQAAQPALTAPTVTTPATPPPPPPFLVARAAAKSEPDTAARPVAVELNGAAAAAAPAPAPGARTLEQVIAELLEPVIRHWLDNNLPGMVEKVVREEVARALAAERASAPIPQADA